MAVWPERGPWLSSKMCVLQVESLAFSSWHLVLEKNLAMEACQVTFNIPPRIVVSIRKAEQYKLHTVPIGKKGNI